MDLTYVLFNLATGVTLAATQAGGVTPPASMMESAPSPEERTAAKEWSATVLPETVLRETPIPFSFVYDGKNSRDILSTWTIERVAATEDAERIEYAMVCTDPQTRLSVRCVITKFKNYPAVEWVLYFKNNGATNTPILSNVLPLDAGFALSRDKAARVHHANGSECRLDDFAPKTTSLGPNEHDPQGAWIGAGNPLRIESKGGRSSCGALPFFNLDMDSHGMVGAVGWTGDWAASFYRTDSEVRAAAGMKKTHFTLLPGEEVRTPRILLLFWQGEPTRGQNLLRQFILAHHSPTVNGHRAQAPVSHATWGGNFAAKHIEHGLWWKNSGLPLDYLWVDAGWFGEDEAKEGATVFNSQWARFVGDWRPNPGYFPEGLRPVADALKNAGIGLLLWVESERVFEGTPWTREHPEFLEGPIGGNFLFNLGHPEARRFLTDELASLIKDNNLGCYRQDFNMDPRPFWDAADAPDRVGIAEIKHITGLYAMWDELREKFPNLLIDNCSSGGRRIDLETVSRSIPLWRSDVQCWPNFGATAMQCQTQGLGQWVPLSTGCCDREDTYIFRSALGPGMVLIMAEFEKDTAKHFSTDWLRARLDELHKTREYFLGDFYPLVSFSLADDTWSAWQYDRPDLGEGMVLALRRPASSFTEINAVLRGLQPGATFEVRNMDTGETIQKTGSELVQTGFSIRIAEKPGSALLVYRKL